MMASLLVGLGPSILRPCTGVPEILQSGNLLTTGNPGMIFPWSSNQYSHSAWGTSSCWKGWAAITTGVAELFGAGRVVYPIGAGLLAWGLYGYRTLWVTMWTGLAALRKMERDHPEDR